MDDVAVNGHAVEEMGMNSIGTPQKDRKVENPRNMK